MVQKVYFDCTWTGPLIEVDKNGRKTNTDSDIKGMFLDPSMTFELGQWQLTNIRALW